MIDSLGELGKLRLVLDPACPRQLSLWKDLDVRDLASFLAAILEPALARLGLRPGDRIVAIDGAPTEELSRREPELLSRLLGGAA